MISSKNFFFLLRREFQRFWGNSVLKMLFLGAPILYGILFGFVYKKGKITHLPIIVVNEDNSPMSYKLLSMLQDNETLNIAALLHERKQLNEKIITTQADGVLILPKRFESDILTRRYPEVLYYVNTDNMLTSNYATKAIQQVLGTFRAGVSIETLKKQGVPDKIALTQYEPFQLTFIKNYNRSANYMYFLWPGFIFTILQQVLFLALALSFSSEFEMKTFSEFTRHTSAPVVAIFVKMAPYLLMSLLIWLFYGFLHLCFRIPLGNHIGGLTFIAILLIISASLMGILTSLLLPNQLKATEILMVIATPSFVLSGFTWPVSQMPSIIQFFSKLIPLTHFLKAYRILTVRGGHFKDIKQEIAYLVGIILICTFAALILLGRKMRKSHIL